jgi:AcrR family transcriptional regulator
MPRRPPGSGAMSVWSRPSHAPRQPVPAFSRDEITRVAIELADAGGLEAVSMRRIAARIGSAPTSLYWYFSDKDELFELMVDAVLGEIPLPGQPSGDWRADLTEIARAVRATLGRHPWFAQLGIHPVAGPQTQRFITVALRTFDGLGLGEQTLADILAAVNNYISGFVQREAAWSRFASRAAAPGPAPAITTAPATTAPATTAPATAPLAGDAGPDSIPPEVLAARTRLSGDASFEFGLQCVLDGIAAHVATRVGE